jgi:hypothetical protein
MKDYGKTIDDDNLIYVNWGELSLMYPDDLPTLHTSKLGQEVVFNRVMAKLNKNKWIL